MKIGTLILIFTLSSMAVSAQQDPGITLQKQFEDYQTGSVQEKLYVHTDKTFYLAGETVWFKVYSVDASFHKPFRESSIAYIEIISRDTKPVVQRKVELIQGNGNGSLILPGYLSTGEYTLRAYTSWMKNFSSEFYFEQIIQIVNTLKTTVAVKSPRPISTIQFFPEGGSFLTGVESNIAFKAVDSRGYGLNCRGVIVNQANDTIIRFESFYNGMGHFLMKPVKNSIYYAICSFQDTVIKQKIPNAEDRGFSMKVTDDENDQVLVTIHASDEFNNTPVYLFTQTRQIVKNVHGGMIRDGLLTISIDKKSLGDGISVITLFNQLRQPVCERLVFKRPKSFLPLQAAADRSEYQKRNLVNIRIGDSLKNNPELSLSMAVIRIDSLQSMPEENIVSYFYLNSELKGPIENPAYYLNNYDTRANIAIDNLMLTQGWRRFKWNDILTSAKPYFEFLPEVEGPVVNGKIINKITGAPVSSADIFMSVPGADYAFNSATSDEQGTIRFGFKDIYKSNVLVFQPAQIKDSGYRVDITPAYSDKPSFSTLSVLNLSASQETALLNRSIGNQVENTYNINKKRQYVISNLDTTSFYGKPGRGYNLDEYTRFQTMEEVMREYIGDVRVRKEGNTFHFRVVNRTFGTYFEEQPLMLIDGIPVNDATKIIELDPLKVKRIEVVMHNYYIGSSAFPGIVNIKSYNGEMGVPVISPNALVVEYEGIQQQREFYSPVYLSPTDRDNHLPDFRNTLYWNPQVQVGSDGKSQVSFYTSDIRGKFAVIVQGISANGIPINAVSYFNVVE